MASVENNIRQNAMEVQMITTSAQMTRIEEQNDKLQETIQVLMAQMNIEPKSKQAEKDNPIETTGDNDETNKQRPKGNLPKTPGSEEFDGSKEDKTSEQGLQEAEHSKLTPEDPTLTAVKLLARSL
jgi:hypothetical protein